MTRVTRATAREIAELEAHATTLNRALEYLRYATENARRDRDEPLLRRLDKEATSLTRELKRVKTERQAIQQELADQDKAPA